MASLRAGAWEGLPQKVPGERALRVCVPGKALDVEPRLGSGREAAEGSKSLPTVTPGHWEGLEGGAAWDLSALRRGMGHVRATGWRGRTGLQAGKGAVGTVQAPRPALGKEWCAGNLGGGLGSLEGGLAGRGRPGWQVWLGQGCNSP